MKTWMPAFIALLAGVSIFSSYKYFASIHEKTLLLEEMDRARNQIAMLDTQRQKAIDGLTAEHAKQQALLDEKAALEGQLRTVRESMDKMQAELDAAKLSIDDLSSRLSMAKVENGELVKTIGGLKSDVSAAVQVKEELQARLNSLPELKKAMRELKRRLSRAKSEITTRFREDQLVIGNGGYMIKDGKPTYPTRVKIEVVPLPSVNP